MSQIGTSKNVHELGEQEFAQLAHRSMDRWFGTRFVGAAEREVRIGKFVLDLVARETDGSIVVIELKTDMHHRALGQLLLYPHAVRTKTPWGNGRRVTSMLITTYLDRNVVEIVDELNTMRPDAPIELKVCVGSEESPRLVDAGDEAAEAQVWDQALTERRTR
jgi:hypothetical protein